MEIYKIKDQAAQAHGYLNFDDFCDTKGLSGDDVQLINDIISAVARHTLIEQIDEPGETEGLY